MAPRPLLLALLAVLALAAAGCGSDDDKGQDEAATTQATASTPAATSSPAPTETATKPKVTVPSGPPPKKLEIKDLKPGSGQAAKAGDALTVQYVGVNYANGKQFDASWDRGQPFPVPLGAGQVIEGWDKGLVGMRKGGRRMLTIPPELAYGSEGYPPTIAPNETLIFVIDALDIKPG
jgi:peptidylprolyl isomerase